MKNYVSLMQIAHMFNQLYELSSLITPLLTSAKMTINHLWSLFIGSLVHNTFNDDQMAFRSTRNQIRYE